ncbi:MAG: SAM-dependent methyltransferase [Porphyromonadaceae bacterium]|jgi:predicted O-methyltransferase YrrM|nr:SAM-dependent methyltransferase [uncultured Macellibacteroides sp.]MCE5226042.1 SAM-dependent methyltransferase [Porphyromonadaceae bacterium]
MQIIPKNNNALRRSILLYRRVRYRKGYGVHSPFVYNVITKVIEESGSYYPLSDIALTRLKLHYREEMVSYPDKRNKEKSKQQTIGHLVQKKAISPKQGALLFKLTNYFKPVHILQIGTTMGLSSLYLTSYASGLRCIALESLPEFAAVARETLKEARNQIDLRVGNYLNLLPQAIQDLKQLDFVFFNTPNDELSCSLLFNECVKHVHQETVFVFVGIKSSAKMRKIWAEICSHPDVTVTIDLYSLGIVFFNNKLHKRNYITYY